MSDQPSQHNPPGDDGSEERPKRHPRITIPFEERPSLTQKSRRIGERIIEGGIYTIAGLSIIFIFLIFYFVFKEASPIFLGTKIGADTTMIAAYELPPGLDTAAPANAAPSDTGDIIAYNAGPELPTPGGTDIASTTADHATKGTDPGKPKAGKGTAQGHGSNPAADTANPAQTAPADTDIVQYNPGPELPGTKGTTADTAAPLSASAKATQDSVNARAIVGKDYPILTRESPVELSYLAYDNWQPNSEHPRYGIYAILIGTAKTTFVALLVATPLAILAALYTAFFAPKRLRETIKPVIEILAGFPSVVLGFFCLMTVASLVQSVFGGDYRLNSVVGGIGLALAVIPIIYTITEDALRAVPQSLREAALALGATEWEAAYKVMLPAATPGVFAAVLLGLGRAVGETMIALMATGNASTFNWDFFQPVRTFAATIGAEMGEVVGGSPHYQLLFLLGVILFIFSFFINLVTEFYVKAKLIKKFRGAE